MSSSKSDPDDDSITDSTGGDLTQQQFDVLTIKWMAKKYLPFSFFDDDFTVDYFKMINPNLKVPNRNTLRKLTEQLFKQTQIKIKEILLANTSAISFTIDGWIAINGKSYYGITGPFITDDFKYHSIVLDFVASNVDNCATNSTFIQEFTNFIASDGFQFDPQNQYFRCVLHMF